MLIAPETGGSYDGEVFPCSWRLNNQPRCGVLPFSGDKLLLCAPDWPGKLLILLGAGIPSVDLQDVLLLAHPLSCFSQTYLPDIVTTLQQLDG